MAVPKVYESEKPFPEIRSHFESIPWALELFNDPSLHPFTQRQKQIDKNYTGDTFWSRTLATEDTVPIWQSFSRSPASNDGVQELLFLLKLGSGITGHVGVCHGGFVSTLLDEVMGLTAEHKRPKDKATMTVTLKVDFKRPVPTPSVILCRASVSKREGRKMWTKATVEDGQGLIFATGEALFLDVDSVKARGKL